MLDASTAGRAQARVRSINVEANLLSQRSSERARLREIIQRRAMMVVGVLILATCTLPPLFLWQRLQNARFARAEQARVLAVRQLDELRQTQERTQPAVQQSAQRREVAAKTDAYLQGLYGFFGASRPELVLTTLKVEIIAGEMKISARGEAESYEVYQAYVKRLQEAAGEQNVIPRSARGSTTLGPEGVVFELGYRAGVKK